MCREVIDSAAIFYNNTVYSLPRPARHIDVIVYLVEVLKFPKPISRGQGFITNSGRFVNRLEALIIAKVANQILPGRGLRPQLYSEDLW